jgi:nicotinate-nucleotide adenylyltransferase
VIILQTRDCLAPVAQWIEHLPPKERVTRSIRVEGTSPLTRMLPTSIGLLGGSFNPPHLAHLALALAAKQQLALTRVDLMPAGQPWQKSGQLLAPVAHRLAMCRAAILDFLELGVEDCETQRHGNTYTVDTLRHLCAQHPETRYTLIIGADQAQHFDRWHDWQTLITLCRLALVARNGLLPTLPAVVLEAIPNVVMVHMPSSTLSSSAIRAVISAGQSFSKQVPSAVERYIVKHSLYKTI